MTEQLIANDLKDVLHRAKDMGCKKVKAFYDIPLENVETVIKALEEIQKYRVLGTVEELREAREKQMPKKKKFREGMSIGELAGMSAWNACIDAITGESIDG